MNFDLKYGEKKHVENHNSTCWDLQNMEQKTCWCWKEPFFVLKLKGPGCIFRGDDGDNHFAKILKPPLEKDFSYCDFAFGIFGSDYMQYLLVTTAAIFVAPWPLLAQNNASYFTKTSYVLTPNGPESIQSKENTSAVMSYFHIFPPSIFSRKNLQNPKWVLFLPPQKKIPTEIAHDMAVNLRTAPWWNHGESRVVKRIAGFLKVLVFWRSSLQKLGDSKIFQEKLYLGWLIFLSCVYLFGVFFWWENRPSYVSLKTAGYEDNHRLETLDVYWLIYFWYPRPKTKTLSLHHRFLVNGILYTVFLKPWTPENQTIDFIPNGEGSNRIHPKQIGFGWIEVTINPPWGQPEDPVEQRLKTDFRMIFRLGSFPEKTGSQKPKWGRKKNGLSLVHPFKIHNVSKTYVCCFCPLHCESFVEKKWLQYFSKNDAWSRYLVRRWGISGPSHVDPSCLTPKEPFKRGYLPNKYPPYKVYMGLIIKGPPSQGSQPAFFLWYMSST